MRLKYFKYIIELFTLLFSIALLGAIGWVVSLDPSSHKDTIIQEVEHILGRRFEIHGDIDWHFGPGIGFTVQHIEVGQKSEFAQSHNDTFAVIETVNVFVQLAPFLNRKIVIDALTLKNAEIYLERNATHNNWDDLLSIHSGHLAIHDVQIENSLIDWQDKPRNQALSFQVENFDIDIGRNIDALVNMNWQPKNLQWQFDINGVQDKLNIAVNDTAGKNIQNMQLSFNNITMNSDKIIIDAINIDSMDLSKIYFDLMVLLLDMHEQHVVIEKFSLGSFSLANIRLDALSSRIDINDHMVRMSPLNANLYAGTITDSTLLLNLQDDIPKMNIDMKLNQADLDLLLKYMAPKNEIKGSINLALHVNASGNDSDKMIKTAEGEADVHIKDCIYRGSDYWGAAMDTLKSANNFKDRIALIKDIPSMAGAQITQHETANHIDGTLLVRNGKVDGVDLVLNDDFPIKRYGPIDLPRQLIVLCFPP